MSTRRPSPWSYVSFSRPGSGGSLLPNHGDDRFEKPGRKMSGAYNPSASFSPAWRPAAQRSRWLKYGGALGLLLLVVYLLMPGETKRHNEGTAMSKTPTVVDSGLKSVSLTTTDEGLTTTKCSKSSDPSKPLIQYVLMIDAGSTGSRIHVYRFNNCGSTPELENEVFEQTEKKKGGSGLSSYDADAQGAAKSLDRLLDVAMDSVPESVRGCTPVAVKATAGLRKLGVEKSERILQAVRHRLETQYPFPVVAADRGGVEVMDGSDEGVYAWITTNYLLGRIGGPSKSPTAAVFDLGGGSTQIVFEPTFPLSNTGGMPETMLEGDHKYALSFGGRNFSLYQHSYLGYGLMAARDNLHQLVLLDAHKAAPHGDTSFLSQPIENPCIQPGQSAAVKVPLPEGHVLGSSVEVKMVGPKSATTAVHQCRALAEKTLEKEAECALSPCAFKGVYQPSLASTFAREDIYLFSYFFDRMSELGLPDEFKLEELKEVARDVCSGEASGAWDRFFDVPEAIDSLRERGEACLDLNFMLSLLTVGYEMPLTRNVRIAKKIAGKELGWCLGASLPLLSQESGWKCRIEQVA